MSSAQRVQGMLKHNGFPTIGHPSEPNDLEDGQVTVTDKVHIQVGHFYVNVVVETEKGCFRFYHQAKTDARLMVDLKEALK